MILLLSLACQSTDKPSWLDQHLPNFALIDVNETSSSFEQSVSLSSFSERSSIWYFGHST